MSSFEPCGAALSFAIMLQQQLWVKLQLIGISCVGNSRAMTCAFFPNLAVLALDLEGVHDVKLHHPSSSMATSNQ